MKAGDIEDVDNLPHGGRHRPLRGAILWASGVNRKVLALVPTEEAKFLVLGGSVIVTALVATASGATAAYMIDGSGRWSRGHLLVGIIAGALVFTVDRLLVKLPLNPYRFPQEALDALWNPSADSQWFSVISKRLNQPSVLARVQQWASTLGSVLVRLIVAFCFSFIVSELVVIFIFDEEVSQRVESIKDDRADAAEKEVRDAHTEELGGIDRRIDALSGEGVTPGLEDAASLEETAQQRVDDLNRDLTIIDAAKNAELQGIASTFVLSDGTEFQTSEDAGRGPLTEQLEGVVAKVNADLELAKTELDRAQQNLDDLRTDADDESSKNDDELATLRTQRATLVDGLPGRIATARTAATDGIVGLLLRREALEQLANDADPSTGEVDAPKRCRTGGLSGAACGIRDRIYRSTPMGPWIAAFRYFFLTIDLLPIIIKAQLALRRRRPYDALIAALEERGNALALDIVDDGLTHVGRDLEARAYWRKAQRTGTGMEYLIDVEASRKERTSLRERARALRKRLPSSRQQPDATQPPDWDRIENQPPHDETRAPSENRTFWRS